MDATLTWAGVGARRRGALQSAESRPPERHSEPGAIHGRANIGTDYRALADESLMEMTAQGDSAALEALYDRHVSGCYGLALKIVADPAIAEEIVQDVFLKIWTSPGRYLPERGKFSGWLLTLVHNRSVDRLRRASSKGKAQNLPLDAENGSGMTIAETHADPGLSPFEEVWRSEQRSMVRMALDMLPAAQRDALALAYFGGLTQKEIADRLGEPLGTIKTRTRSGLLHLRRLVSVNEIQRGLD